MNALASATGRAISQRPPVGKIALWYRCLRKLPYSKKAAGKMVVDRNRRLKTGERAYTSYVCSHCGQYHVGHMRREAVSPS